MPEKSELKFVQASLMVASSYPTRPVAALFFHGRSFGDITGLFPLAASLYSDGLVKKVVLFNNEGERCGSDVPFQANQGRTYYRNELKANGIPDSDIVDSILKSCHTLEESRGFVDLSIRESWVSAAIMGQPHQLLRIMLSTLKAMEERRYGLEIYSATPRNVKWFDSVYGSQGAEGKPRLEHVKDEYLRIRHYIEKGDLVSLKQLLSYIEQREKGQLVLGPTDRGSQLFYRDLPTNAVS